MKLITKILKKCIYMIWFLYLILVIELSNLIN